MKTIKKLAVWLTVLMYIVLALGFAANRSEGQLCNRLVVSVTDSTDLRFLKAQDIIKILNRYEIEYLGVPLGEINLDTMEKVICTNQIVKHCKAYAGINGTLRIEVSQRAPFVRVMEKNGRGYYLDREGNILNLSPRFSPHVLVVNGNLKTSFRIGDPVNVSDLADSRENQKLREIFELAQFFEDSPLWKSQFVQLYINSSGDYELIPRVGPHIIVLGTLDEYAEKFEKLEVFYKEGLNNVGWNNYVKINLKYKDQVVCTKI